MFSCSVGDGEVTINKSDMVPSAFPLLLIDAVPESCQITEVFPITFFFSVFSLSGTRFPQTCPEGTFTPPNMTGLWNEKECLPCLPGHYCR